MAKFIVADDANFIRKNLKSILLSEGHEIIFEANNGETAVEAYRKFKPDIITLDIGMPHMDGITAINHIISEFPNAKIIVVTVFKNTNLIYKAIKCGAKDYITKPIDENQVSEVINRVLSM